MVIQLDLQELVDGTVRRYTLNRAVIFKLDSNLLYVPDMGDFNDAVSINTLAGMTVLSLMSGNKVGQVLDARLDPVNGRVVGLVLDGGEERLLSYDRIHSFGRDAIMAESDDSAVSGSGKGLSVGRAARDLLGTKVVMESGEILGEIADVLVTFKPPPAVVYEIRRSMLDRLLGRTFFIPASVGYALSDDAARLVVPDLTAEVASSDISSLAGPAINVVSFPRTPVDPVWREFNDGTVLIDRDEDATVLRRREDEEEDDETLLVRPDEDETIIRRRPAEELS